MQFLSTVVMSVWAQSGYRSAVWLKMTNATNVPWDGTTFYAFDKYVFKFFVLFHTKIVYIIMLTCVVYRVHQIVGSIFSQRSLAPLLLSFYIDVKSPCPRIPYTRCCNDFLSLCLIMNIESTHIVFMDFCTHRSGYGNIKRTQFFIINLLNYYAVSSHFSFWCKQVKQRFCIWNWM